MLILDKMYSVTLKLNETTYNAKGKTLDEALINLAVPQPKTKGVFTFTKDGVTSKPAYLNIRQLSFLSVPNMMGQIKRAALIKRMSLWVT